MLLYNILYTGCKHLPLDKTCWVLLWVFTIQVNYFLLFLSGAGIKQSISSYLHNACMASFYCAGRHYTGR